ncbi:hypothetical protein C8P65_10493 [Capnocytophaga leadbetteri]|uniref:Uncharacterized protein n=2 Tax=Capnocytophaga leadbetteri TaxID=327575 RepID=A0A2T5XVM5_9FLAO|nr:hypothetical protein [Capnocytophaga leadbetteri]PTX07402.1 hypothetical protein C8P65_10493 [Capnocytophaga leadbetteri]
MDSLPFTYFLPLLFFELFFLYLAIVRKNAFEKRLALFNPTRQLSQERQAYMQKVYKYCKYFNSILLIIFYLPLCFFITLIIKERYEETGKLVIPISNNMMMILLVLFLAHYLIIYLKKRKAKALRMFLEQMSDNDFELLLKVKDSLSFTNKYNPPFVLCNHQLYVFSFFSINEIDPSKVTEVNWSYGKHSIFVLLKTPKRISVILPQGGFCYFLQIIEQYTELKFYYK